MSLGGQLPAEKNQGAEWMVIGSNSVLCLSVLRYALLLDINRPFLGDVGGIR